MAYTGPTVFVNVFEVDAADVADNTFESAQLNAGVLPPMKFSGKTIALYNVTASLDGAVQCASEAACATADGSDAATTLALANALKVKLNSILTKLKTSKLMAT